MSDTKLVLYVEDNPANVKLVERIFKLRPHLRLHAAFTGKQGFEFAREQQPQLVVLDVNLPDINGDAVLRLLQKDPTTSGIPVVFLSANATPSQISSLMEAGARDYVMKPLDVTRFLSVVDRILGAVPMSLASVDEIERC